jgi:hypothetical protein
MSDINQFTTSDLPLAAFLVIKGLSLVKAKKAYNGKFEFVLDDPDEVADELSIEYINSDFCKFDNQIRSIKKLLYTSK